MMTLTSLLSGIFEMAIGAERSISSPSTSEMLSLENPLVIVVSPVVDL